MLRREQSFLSVPTDTATPVTPIPILYIHAGTQAFCSQPDCICHANERLIGAFLQGVLDGDLKLRKVYNNVLVGKEVS